VSASTAAKLGVVILNQPLMNAEFIGIPSLAALTTRCLARCNFELLCLKKGLAGTEKWRGNTYRKTNWPFHRKILGLGTFRELATDFFERLNTAACEGNPDAMNLLRQVSRDKSCHRVLYKQAGQ
jgi:hypothetical protein